MRASTILRERFIKDRNEAIQHARNFRNMQENEFIRDNGGIKSFIADFVRIARKAQHAALRISKDVL